MWLENSAALYQMDPHFGSQQRQVQGTNLLGFGRPESELLGGICRSL